jgi:hypothetical protein
MSSEQSINALRYVPLLSKSELRAPSHLIATCGHWTPVTAWTDLYEILDQQVQPM